MNRRFGNVAVLMGGISSEREISLKSGKAVAAGLEEGGYTVSEVDITSRNFSLPDEVEAVFVALHGQFGEDGGIQQVLADRGIPFTGSGAESSRISFDKILTRERLQAHGIPVPKGEIVTRMEDRSLPVPLVAKPPREGSSVGCYLVFEEHAWASAFDGAVQYSGQVLVEEYIPGRELTVGIIDRQVLPVVEIKPCSGWYSFDAKYVTGDTEYNVPAELDQAIAGKLQSIAMDTFEKLGAEGFGRVDFRLTPESEPYVLELNSIPGFTESSLLPKAAKAAGIGFSELCCRIMEMAHL